MSNSPRELWSRFNKYYSEFPTIHLNVDLSRMNFPDELYETLGPKMQNAYVEMVKLEGGATANPDENRMVGHYWLRNPSLAPRPELTREIQDTLEQILGFVERVHSGAVHGSGGQFKNLLVIGIGGSALGPQFVSRALGHPERDLMRVYFFDNTDPDGMDVVLAELGKKLGQTLCVVISKSGGTKETRNGMLEAKASYERARLKFAEHAVAITGKGSELDKLAQSDGWLQRFPMWDWVGGRTSETSAVGILPAALQGIQVAGILDGARACDEVTREQDVRRNPAMQLAVSWYHAGQGKGLKDMVILPYKDRLELFSRYLQQLVMESLGKERDVHGQVVNQGIAVYGNKGSTDQHAYIQQLRDGINNFFVTFIRVLQDRAGQPFWVEADATSGDYLDGFLLGTRKALYENGRESVTITVKDVSPFTVGVLIALYERAVGFYASMVEINAYHQPGVEGGKKAAGDVLALQRRISEYVKPRPGQSFTPEQLATAIGSENDPERVFHILEHLSANPGRGISKRAGGTPHDSEYFGS